MTDVIFISLENWDDIWRRNQFFCREFATRFPERRVLFIGPPRDVSHLLRKGSLLKIFSPRVWRNPMFPNITVMQPLKLLPNTIPCCRWFNEWVARKEISFAAHRLRMDAPILWLNAHYAVHMAGRMGESTVVYDVTDDWTQLKQSAVSQRLTCLQDSELCDRADLVLVCSQLLFAMKAKLAVNVHLIPNGVDADHYRSILDTPSSKPEETKLWKKPVLGYTGSIHADRVDIELLEELADRMPESTIALVGPVMLGGTDRKRLQQAPNIVMTGPVSYDRIPDYMRAFDVCITPHKVTAFTESLNPIKLWEYLAAGKPIVSAPVAGFRDFPDLVYLARDCDGFVQAIQEALREPVSKSTARRAEARRHSWKGRFDLVVKLLEMSLKQKMELKRSAARDELATVTER